MPIQPLHHLDLLGDDLTEDPALHSKQPSGIGIFMFDSGVYGHPDGDAAEDLQHYASGRPDVDYPGVLVLGEFLQQVLGVGEVVLEENVVEDLWRHVLGGCH